MRPFYNVAVDGPSGAGKSTICKVVANRLGLTYIDTGAMYRAIAYGMVKHHIDIYDEQAVNEGLSCCQLDYDSNGQLCLNGEILLDQIRTDQVSLAASCVAKYSGVRHYCVALQQKIAAKGGFIMDGRDIATVVLPNAQVKIYLTADVQTRAKRRYLQNQEKHIDCTYEHVLEDVKARDHQDMTRANSPLVQAKDATVVDSSDLSFDQTVDTLVRLIQTTIKKEDSE